MPNPQMEKKYNQRLEQMMSSGQVSNGENFKLGIILLSVFILIICVIFATYLFRNKKISSQTVTNYNNQATSGEPQNKNNKSNNSAVINNLIQDADRDGLSDQDENTLYHTDANKTDTDGDGLNDREEVKVYQTDPLKADTDGDGLNDGQEIKNGTDPLNPAPGAKWPPAPTNLSNKK